MKTTKESNQYKYRNLFLLSFLVVVLLTTFSLAICGVFTGSISMTSLGFGTSLNLGLFLASFSMLFVMNGILYYLITNNKRELDV